VVAIAAQRDRVRDPVVHRVAVDVVDLQRHIGPAAIAAAAPVDREHLRPELRELAATRPAWTVGGAVGAVRQHSAAQAGTTHQRLGIEVPPLRKQLDLLRPAFGALRSGSQRVVGSRDCSITRSR
jgi:hypothetical protein